MTRKKKFSNYEKLINQFIILKTGKYKERTKQLSFLSYKELAVPQDSQIDDEGKFFFIKVFHILSE